MEIVKRFCLALAAVCLLVAACSCGDQPQEMREECMIDASYTFTLREYAAAKYGTASDSTIITGFWTEPNLKFEIIMPGKRVYYVADHSCDRISDDRFEE